MGFEANLLKLRTRLNLSQEQLAKSLGLSGKIIICRWETGTRTPIETIRRLVLLLNDLPKDKALAFIAKLESYEE